MGDLESLKIDRNNLDFEFISNPELVLEAGDRVAEAVSIRDTAKEKLDTVNAEVESEMRSLAESSKTKLTEAGVAMKVQLDPRHQRAAEALNQAKLEAALAMSFERAVTARSEALKMLAELYKSGYFAVNSARETPSQRDVQYKLMRERLAANRLKAEHKTGPVETNP